MKKIIHECIEYIRGGAESVKADLFKKRSLHLAEINIDEVELYILENKESTLVLVEGQKNGKVGLKVENPFILYNEDGSETEEYKRLLVEVK